ncbi:MAG: hypothetical protein ACTH7X_08980 [Brevibacterium aurantiacum]
MNIRDEARQEAEREMAEAREQVGITVQEQRRYIEGFTAGAVWASDQADREPSDAEVIGAAREYHERGNGEGSFERMADHVRDSLIFRMRAALLAAQEVRDES